MDAPDDHVTARVVRPIDPKTDAGSADDLLERELSGRLQARRGTLMDPLEGEVLVAEVDGRPAGLIGWVVGGEHSGPDEAEIRVLVVEPADRWRGVGSALLAEAERRLAADGVRAAWLVTTNDNLDALAFYGRRGWLVAAIHGGAVDEARRTLKAAIPEIAENGIPIRDELILSKGLG